MYPQSSFPICSIPIAIFKGNDILALFIKYSAQFPSLIMLIILVLVQLVSYVQLFVTSWIVAYKAPLPSSANSFPEFAQIHVHWVSDVI